jgi:hypothetical protein
MQMFAAASSNSADADIELAKFACFLLAHAGSLVWTLWIVGKLNFVKSIVERKGGMGGEDAKGSARSGKVWNVRRQSKEDALFAHVEWRGPEFYLNSMKLLVSSSVVSLTFGASLFSADLGALNLLVALSLTPSILAIAQTPTILKMYQCASAAANSAASCDARASGLSDCGGLDKVLQRVAQDLGSAVRVATKQVAKDVNWATVGAATAACAAVAIQAAACNMHNDMLTAIVAHARHDVVQNEWVRDAMILLRAVEDLPVVLRDNIESMFPRVKPLIKISPVVTHAVKVCSALQFMV